MSSREIVLWLDERWYAALEKRLRNKTLPEKLEELLDDLINNLVPQDEYDRIDSEIREEREQLEAQREADRRFAVFHVIERGEQCCFLVEQPIDLLAAARSMRHYTRKEGPGSDFRHYYATAQDITPKEYEQYVVERMEGAGRVVGAFEIDFDEGTFFALDAENGWKAYPIKDVSMAVYKATRKQGMSNVFYQVRLAEELAGKELAEQTQPTQSMSMGQTMY